MTRSLITIATDQGPRELHAFVLDEAETFAVHETTGRLAMRPWTLTHVPTGRGIVKIADHDDAIRIGHQLLGLARNGEWSSTDPAHIEKAVPGEVKSWLKQCWDARAFVPPSSTAARTPQEKKMPKQKTFKAGPIANRIVRNLAQSMTPENRKAFHEGLRVATKDQITDALDEAFRAGAGGCVFSKE